MALPGIFSAGGLQIQLCKERGTLTRAFESTAVVLDSTAGKWTQTMPWAAFG
jgi:hypothetical protein